MRNEGGNDSSHDEMTTPPSGSGFGPYVEGEPIVSTSQLRAGDLLTDYSIQFHARNIVRVTSVEDDKFHGRFVDPDNTSVRRRYSIGDICFWDWQINPEQPSTFTCSLHRASNFKSTDATGTR